MDPITQQTALATAGAAGAEALYVDDVFSTYLYEGDSGPQTITNGIDLAGEGGLVWIKNRDYNYSHVLQDTERGVKEVLYSDNNNASPATISGTYDIYQFNNNGFSLGYSFNGYVNDNNHKYASWTFRKAPGFFDVVTYTGNGTAGRTVPHNLKSVPGFIVVKELNTTSNWVCYHRSTGNGYALYLNTTEGKDGPNKPSWNQTTPTSTEFTVGVDGYHTNDNNTNYVAYLFAHDDQSFGTDSDEAIIKCGSFSSDSNGEATVDVGFEPQWVLWKRTDASGNWFLADTVRGMFKTDTGQSPYLRPNLNNDEASLFIETNSTGFFGSSFTASSDWIYVAIRRPHKPPEAGTDVFAMDTLGATSPSPPGWTAGFVVDWEFSKTKTNTSNFEAITRITGAKNYLDLNYMESSIIGTNDSFDYSTGWSDNTGPNSDNHSWMFKRAPGFFDVVTWTGDGSSPRQISHNLKSTPELIIVKRRNASNDWQVYHSGVTNNAQRLFINSDSGAAVGNYWDVGTIDANEFGVWGTNEVNGAGAKYVAYLFASLSNVSKIGSYTGTGAAQNIDCGFTNGARFVLIKRTDANGHWVFFDTLRGINAGTDSELALSQNSAQNTSKDPIDPYSQGFALTTVQDQTNVTGGNYVFLAIA